MPAARLQGSRVAAPVNDQTPPAKPRKARAKVKNSTKLVSDNSITREVPIGWRGKGPSRQAYAEFGAANGFDKSFQINQDKKRGKDERDDESGNYGNSGNSEGGGGGVGGDDDPGTESVDPSEEKESQDIEEDSLNDFQDGSKASNSHAQSLFSHTFEDEMRNRLNVKQIIQDDFSRTGDEKARRRQISAERARQKAWQEAYTALETARVTRDPSNYDLPFDDHQLTDTWMWSRKKVIAVPPSTLKELGVACDASYQKCFAYISGTERLYLWESEFVKEQMIQVLLGGTETQFGEDYNSCNLKPSIYVYPDGCWGILYSRNLTGQEFEGTTMPRGLCLEWPKLVPFDRTKSSPLSIQSGDTSEVWSSMEMILPLFEINGMMSRTIFCSDGNGSWDFGVVSAPCKELGTVDTCAQTVYLFIWAK